MDYGRKLQEITENKKDSFGSRIVGVMDRGIGRHETRNMQLSAKMCSDGIESGKMNGKG